MKPLSRIRFDALAGYSRRWQRVAALDKYSHLWRIVGMLDTRSALLQALIRGDSYGLELIDRVRKATNGHLKLMQGRVYPVLRQLEADGLLESYDGPPMAERGGRPRRYYKLTAKGLRIARQEAAALAGLLKPATGVA